MKNIFIVSSIALFFLISNFTTVSAEDDWKDPTQKEKDFFKKLKDRLEANKDKMPVGVNDALNSLSAEIKIEFECKDENKKAKKVEIKIKTTHKKWDKNKVKEKDGWYEWGWYDPFPIKDDVKIADFDNVITIDVDSLSGDEKSLHGKVENTGILYHELLHAQLLINAMKNDHKWQEEFCKCNLNLTPADLDDPHTKIPDLQKKFTDRLWDNVSTKSMKELGDLWVYADRGKGNTPIYDTIDQELVASQFISTGHASSHVADLTITSNADELITISIKPSGLEGLLLLNPNKDEQDLVITGVFGVRINKTAYKPADNVTLKPDESVTLPVEGYCANFDKKNPSEVIKLTLNGPTAPEPYNPTSYAIDALENTIFPENFTSEDVVAIRQIIIWMSQPENKDKTSEDYAKRGYPIKEEYKPIIKDILNQTGTNPDEVVALTGKKKGGISQEPEKPSEEFPWIYVVAAIAGILAIVGVSKILKK